MSAHHLVKHCHGKSRVRVARVWRSGSGLHHFAEWTVEVLLESAMAAAFLHGDNSGMTATDTVKNSVRRCLCASVETQSLMLHTRCTRLPRRRRSDAAAKSSRWLWRSISWRSILWRVPVASASFLGVTRCQPRR